ncbi:hypothetical protein ACMFMG_011172 [Clarireedia jacksonii]
MPGFDRDRVTRDAEDSKKLVQEGSLWATGVNAPRYLKFLRHLRRLSKRREDVTMSAIPKRQTTRAVNYARKHVRDCDDRFMQELRILYELGEFQGFHILRKLFSEMQNARDKLGPIEQESMEKDQDWEWESTKLVEAENVVYLKFKDELETAVRLAPSPTSGSSSSDGSYSDYADQNFGDDIEDLKEDTPYHTAYMEPFITLNSSKAISEDEIYLPGAQGKDSLPSTIPEKEPSPRPLLAGGVPEEATDFPTFEDKYNAFSGTEISASEELDRMPHDSITGGSISPRQRISVWMTQSVIVSKWDADLIKSQIMYEDTTFVSTWAQLLSTLLNQGAKSLVTETDCTLKQSQCPDMSTMIHQSKPKSNGEVTQAASNQISLATDTGILEKGFEEPSTNPISSSTTLSMAALNHIIFTFLLDNGLHIYLQKLNDGLGKDEMIKKLKYLLRTFSRDLITEAGSIEEKVLARHLRKARRDIANDLSMRVAGCDNIIDKEHEDGLKTSTLHRRHNEISGVFTGQKEHSPPGSGQILVRFLMRSKAFERFQHTLMELSEFSIQEEMQEFDKSQLCTSTVASQQPDKQKQTGAHSVQTQCTKDHEVHKPNTLSASSSNFSRDCCFQKRDASTQTFNENSVIFTEAHNFPETNEGALDSQLCLTSRSDEVSLKRNPESMIEEKVEHPFIRDVRDSIKSNTVKAQVQASRRNNQSKNLEEPHSWPTHHYDIANPDHNSEYGIFDCETQKHISDHLSPSGTEDYRWLPHPYQSPRKIPPLKVRKNQNTKKYLYSDVLKTTNFQRQSVGDNFWA